MGTPEPPSSEDVLRLLGQRSSEDGHLTHFLDLAVEESWFGIALTVMVGGAFLTGVLGRPEDTAEYIDGQVEQALTPEATTLSPTAAEKWRSFLLGPASAGARTEQAREELREIDLQLERYASQGVSYSDLPADAKYLVDVRYASPAHFSLMDVTVFSGGGQITSPLVRVRTASVDAWWLGGPPAIASD